MYFGPCERSRGFVIKMIHIFIIKNTEKKVKSPKEISQQESGLDDLGIRITNLTKAGKVAIIGRRLKVSVWKAELQRLKRMGGRRMLWGEKPYYSLDY